MQVITIDGPASSGKGTVAAIIAAKLGFHYLESGAIYRVVGLLAQRNNLTPENIPALVALIDQIKLRFKDKQVLLNEENVTDLIRAEHIGMLASNVAKVAAVRDRLMQFQRSFAAEPGLVTDGRDMGSVVFPHATLKIFLTASAETRAQRRAAQIGNAGYAAILADIVQRDKQDSERQVAPLKADATYTVIDNSKMTIAETVVEILELLEQKSTL